MRPSRAFFLLLVATPLGCLPPDGTGTGGSGGTSNDAGEGGSASAAGRACLDTADAFGKAQQRCGGDYEAGRNAIIRDLAKGDCESVTIRNERELRGQCLPSLARSSCADIQNQRFDPSCAEQIVRSL